MINLSKFKKYKPENQNEWKVYFLVYRIKIVYIGCTNNISKRLHFHSNYYDPYGISYRKGHLGKKKFTSYRYILVKNKKRETQLEYKLIKKYIPKYNNYKEYYWKPTNKTIVSDRSIYSSVYGTQRTNLRILCEWTKR